MGLLPLWLIDMWQSVLDSICFVCGHCWESWGLDTYWCKRCGEIDVDWDFADCVRDTIATIKGSRKVLADKFQVSEETVERWASGAATPHSKLQEMVLAFLAEEDVEELSKG